MGAGYAGALAVLVAVRHVVRRRWYRAPWCPGEQVDAVAGGQGEAGLGVLQTAVAQDGDRVAAGWPGDGAKCLA